MPFRQRSGRLSVQSDLWSYQPLELRRLLSGTAPDASIYEPGQDPIVGSVVTAFLQNDPENSNDSYDILTGWKAAVDEFVSVGMEEIAFAVFRQVTNGNLSGGPSIATVDAAVEYASANDLSVTILPLFETDQGWRGDYDPSGVSRTRFQTQYQAWISDLAAIENIDRFNIGSELNRMVSNPDNQAFFADLMAAAQTSFVASGNVEARIGYAANFDALDDPQHVTLLTHPDIDFMGVSAYASVIASSNAGLVSGTEAVADETFSQMVANWTNELDRISAFATTHDLPLLIQEFGAVQQNYASVAPFATDPGDWVSGSLPDRYASDPLEQAALYESLITALNGRGDDFESVTFWTWEHQASRGQRTFEQLGTTGVIEKFAIWPTDGGGGQFLSQFLATNTSDQLLISGTSLNDTIELFESDTSLVVTVNGSSQTHQIGTFSSVLVEAGAGDDVVRRTGGVTIDVSIDGGEGDDELRGGNGAETLIGNAGNDFIVGGNGHDQIFGGAGDDTISGLDGNDYVEGGDGNDLIYGGNGVDTIYGQEGNDRLFGHYHNDFLYGGNGDDELHGSFGNDFLSGGEGRDLLSGLGGSDYLIGGSGNDSLYGGGQVDLLSGGANDDNLFGNDGDDILYGGTGDDTLSGNDGNDQMHGEDGTDTLNGGRGDDQLFGGAANGLQFLIGGNDNDFVVGGSGRDIVSGNDGDDRLEGSGGNDLIYGGNGADLLFGQAGYDLLYGHDGDDQVFGGSGVDEVNGGTGNDVLNGGEGDDILSGQEGNDVLSGEDGNDRLFGGLGDDEISGGNGSDLLAGNENNDALFGDDGDDTVSGHDGDDALYGGNGSDSLNGGDGNDTLDAGSGAINFLIGGNGSDNLRGGSGVDIIRGEAGDDVATGGSGDDKIYGGDGNDFLDGSLGNDEINGGNGRDFLVGGFGLDQLDGEAGEDLLLGDALNSSLSELEQAALFDLWQEQDNYEDRIESLQPELASQMVDDQTTDSIRGGSELDLFGAKLDEITDLEGQEEFFD